MGASRFESKEKVKLGIHVKKKDGHTTFPPFIGLPANKYAALVMTGGNKKALECGFRHSHILHACLISC